MYLARARAIYRVLLYMTSISRGTPYMALYTLYIHPIYQYIHPDTIYMGEGRCTVTL